MRMSAAMVAAGFLCCGAASAWAQEPADTCALMRGEEIRAVQGRAVTEMKGSRPTRTGLAVTQCFYTVEPFEKSISLEVTRRLASAAAGPHQDWMQLFHSKANPASPKPGQASAALAKKKDVGEPQRVKGVGDEAFWVGDQVVGALYVLAGDAYFRISVGGWADEKLRQKKTKQLARIIVKRLSGSPARANSPSQF